jgi:hypothetical protein
MRSEGLSLLLAVACRPVEAPGSPEAAPIDGETSTALEPATPINRATGERLDAIVPLLDGGALDLAELRGRAVLLEISATWAEGWAEGHAAHRLLVDELGDRVAVVVLAADADPMLLENERAGPWTVGWDPMGALAARLSVAGFPTYVVLDPAGRIAAVQRGANASDLDQLHAAVRAALEAAGP